MASSKEYLQFILEQLSDLEEINYRAMMGEYIICKDCPYKKECIKGNNCKTPRKARKMNLDTICEKINDKMYNSIVIDYMKKVDT